MALNELMKTTRLPHRPVQPHPTAAMLALVVLCACLFSLAGAEPVKSAGPGQSSNASKPSASFPAASAPADGMTIAYWGGMGSIYYAPGGRDPEVQKLVENGLHVFRDANPNALMLDLGGFVAPIVIRESVYELPPLTLYKEIRVEGVNATAGDWLNLLPGDLIHTMPSMNPATLLSTWVTVDGRKPRAIEKAKTAEVNGRTVILAGISRFRTTSLEEKTEDMVNRSIDTEMQVRRSIQILRHSNPGALSILLADLDRVEVERISAHWREDVDLFLVNRVSESPSPARLDSGAWILERFPVGTMGVASISFGKDGRISRMEVSGSDLIPVSRPKKNLWMKLGISSPKPVVRRIALPVPLPKIGLNLEDPMRPLADMGYPEATCVRRICDGIPKALLARIANEKVAAFEVNDKGTLVGRLYRIRHELPDLNGNFGMTVLFDSQGKMVRLVPANRVTFGLRTMSLDGMCKSWENKNPSELVPPPEWSQGIEDQIQILIDDLRLAEEIDRACR